jgi:hypothetical protein
MVALDAPVGRGPREQGQLRRELRSGALTLPRLVSQRPASLRSLTLVAVVLELPGFGCRRLERLNERAIADGVNLAVTLGAAPPRTLRWLVREITGLDEVAVAPIPEDGDWRAVAPALDELVLDHERSVRDESLPPERWALADEHLHRERARLMRHAHQGSAP